jgi:hypothetical protein
MRVDMVNLNTKIAGLAIVAIPVLVSFFLVSSEIFSPNGTHDQIPVIKADLKPIKRRPVDPGGMDIPFQGFSIWSVLEAGR